MLPERLDAFQWHYYGFELPAGAELLADNDAARQAYRLGERTWGVQFHPEVTRHMLDYWFVEGVEELPDPARIKQETDAHLATWNAQGRRLCGAFLDYAGRLRSPLLDRQRGVGRPLVPRADVVARLVAGGTQQLDGRRRADTGVAVRDHLGALGRTDEGPNLVRVGRRREREHIDVAGAREMAVADVAGIAHLPPELDVRADVEHDEPVFPEPALQLLACDLAHTKLATTPISAAIEGRCESVSSHAERCS